MVNGYERSLVGERSGLGGVSGRRARRRERLREGAGGAAGDPAERSSFPPDETNWRPRESSLAPISKLRRCSAGDRHWAVDGFAGIGGGLAGQLRLRGHPAGG